MKKQFFFLSFIAFALIFVSAGCSKNKTGDLIINVVDGLNSSVGANRTVYLYTSAQSFDDGQYSKSATTNSSGQVTFTKLEPGVYYADCDWQNSLGGTITSSGSGEVFKKMQTTITLAP
jgi:uncharacterized protein (DUF2141 family)